MMGTETEERSESDIMAAQERQRLRARRELEMFLEAELDLIGYKNEPLRWQQEVGKEAYPTLAGLAFVVFSMPAMSSECGRARRQDGYRREILA